MNYETSKTEQMLAKIIVQLMLKLNLESIEINKKEFEDSDDVAIMIGTKNDTGDIVITKTDHRTAKDMMEKQQAVNALDELMSKLKEVNKLLESRTKQDDSPRPTKTNKPN